MTVSEAVKKALKAKGKTQSELAESLGIGQSSIAMYLKREAGIKIENLLRMLNSCGFDLVAVDRDDVNNAYVIGENDKVELMSNETIFTEHIRKIVDDELRKRLHDAKEGGGTDHE